MPKITSAKSPSSDSAKLPSEMRGRIINYIRAGYPGLYLVSHEEQRVDGEMKSIAQELKYNLVLWSAVDGLVDTAKRTATAANDPLEALLAIREMKDKTIILLRDFHLSLIEPDPILVRQLKDVLQEAKTKFKTLIILGCRLCLPPELERELTVVEFALPGKEELGVVLGGIMESAGIKPDSMEQEAREKAIDAASGLTTIEAENAFALSVVESKGISYLGCRKRRVLCSWWPRPMTCPNCRLKCSGKAGSMNSGSSICPIKRSGRPSGAFRLRNTGATPRTTTRSNWPGRPKD